MLLLFHLITQVVPLQWIKLFQWRCDRARDNFRTRYVSFNYYRFYLIHFLPIIEAVLIAIVCMGKFFILVFF